MRVVRLAAGGAHNLALSSTGGVFSCGSGLHGQLGRDTSKGGRGAGGGGGCRGYTECGRVAGLPCHPHPRTASLPAPPACAGTDVPRPISSLWPLGVVQVACGQSHSAALLADGRLLTWGFGRCVGAEHLGECLSEAAALQRGRARRPEPQQAGRCRGALHGCGAAHGCEVARFPPASPPSPGPTAGTAPWACMTLRVGPRRSWCARWWARRRGGRWPAASTTPCFWQPMAACTPGAKASGARRACRTRTTRACRREWRRCRGGAWCRWRPARATRWRLQATTAYGPGARRTADSCPRHPARRSPRRSWCRACRRAAPCCLWRRAATPLWQWWTAPPAWLPAPWVSASAAERPAPICRLLPCVLYVSWLTTLTAN